MKTFTVIDHAGAPDAFKADSYTIDTAGNLHLIAGERSVASYAAPAWKAVSEDEARPE
jgi:hypothetical protein